MPMPAAEFKPTISAGEQPQTHALDRATTEQKYIIQTVTAEIQNANAVYFQRKIHLSGFSAYPDGSLSHLIFLISGVLIYV